jgi:hypothetical protein
VFCDRIHALAVASGVALLRGFNEQKEICKGYVLQAVGGIEMGHGPNYDSSKELRLAWILASLYCFNS